MTKAAEKTRITACKRILKNARKHYSQQPSMEFLRYANIEKGFQYVFDGYRIAAFKNPLPLEENPNNVELNYNLEDYLQENTDNSTILNIPDKTALKSYIKSHKEELKAMGIKHPASPMYNFGKDLPMVNSEYLLDMLNMFPDGTFYANNQYNIFVKDSEGNKGNLLGVRKHPSDTNAGVTKL